MQISTDSLPPNRKDMRTRATKLARRRMMLYLPLRDVLTHVVAEVAYESINLLTGPFDNHMNSPIGKILHKTRHLIPNGDSCRVITKSNPLHPTGEINCTTHHFSTRPASRPRTALTTFDVWLGFDDITKPYCRPAISSSGISKLACTFWTSS